MYDKINQSGESTISRGSSVKIPRMSMAEEGYKSYQLMYTKKCPCCGQKYDRYVNEIEYTITLGRLVKRVCNNRKNVEYYDTYSIKNIKKIQFCSWNCKQKYIRENDLRRCITDSFSNDLNTYITKEDYDKQGGF